MTSNSKAQGRYSKLDFIYVAQDNEYQCPAGQRLTYRHSTIEEGMKIDVYWTSVCQTCPQKALCTTGKERRVRRWEHEDVLDRSEEHTSELQSLMRNLYAVLCLKKTI